MRLFVVDPHPIFRRGMAASLAMMDGVSEVTDTADIRHAWEHPSLWESDLIVLDCVAMGGLEFISAVREATRAAVLVCSADCRELTVAAALREGATGFLRKDALTHESLQAALAAVHSGASVLADGLLAGVVSAVPVAHDEAAARALARLTDRERRVLTLIAEGCPTREIAEHLNYSERTVKNVLHDVVTKLNARSRSQAVAQAVREGLIQ